MAFRLRPSEGVADGLRRLARGQLKRARQELRRAASPSDTAIHEARKCIKKTRVILRLCQLDGAAGTSRCGKRLRRINRSLSKLRDAHAMLETLAALRCGIRTAKDREAGDRMRRTLVSRKNKAMRAAATANIWHDIVRDCQKVWKDVQRWKPKDTRFAVLAPGILRSYRAGRKALARAKTTGRAPDFHEWRKQVKTLWYELRLIAGTALHHQIGTLHHLEDWLGDDHNIAVLCDQLLAEWPADTAVRRRADTKVRSLRRRALQKGTHVYAHNPKLFVRSVKRGWNAFLTRPQTRSRRKTASKQDSAA